MIISDGWTSIQARAIANALLATPAGAMFLTALDTSGSTKDAKFIADFIINIIEARGPENIVAVCMDGACAGSFPLITAKYEHGRLDEWSAQALSWEIELLIDEPITEE